MIDDATGGTLVRLCPAYCLNGKKCGNPATEPDGRCAEHTTRHGRTSGGGVKPDALARRKKKRIQYTRYLPTHLRDSYRKIAASSDLLSLQRDVALLQVRLNQIAGRLNTNETTDKWRALKNAFHEFRKAIQTKDTAAQQLWFGEMDGLLAAGNTEEDVWVEIIYLQQKKAELVHQESRRHYLMGATATGEQVRYLVQTIMGIIIENVGDARTIDNIKNDIAALQIFDLDVASPFAQEAAAEPAGG